MVILILSILNLRSVIKLKVYLARFSHEFMLFFVFKAQKGNFETKINFIYIINFSTRVFSTTTAGY